MPLQHRDLPVDLPRLVVEVAPDRLPQAFVGDPVRGIGGHGQVAARELVRPLCAGLDPRQPVGDGVVDGAVVAGLEVEEAVLLDAAPAMGWPARSTITSTTASPMRSPSRLKKSRVR